MMHEWCYKMRWVKCWLFSRIPCNVTRTSKLRTFSLQHVSSSIRLKVSWFSFLHVVFPQVLFIILMYNSCWLAEICYDMFHYLALFITVCVISFMSNIISFVVDFT